MTPIDVVTYAVPFFVVLILLEMVWAARNHRDKYEPRDTLTSLGLGLGSTVAGALAAGLIYAVAMWFYEHRFATIPVTWWAWGLCFVLDDFNYYLFHRSAHRVRWFWAAHVNHHSSQHYNLSTALRQTWTGPLAGSFLFRIWPALIGFHPAMILTVGGANLIYQFWIHTETIGRMPRWFEGVFNTPSHHRVHHATNPLYLDRNYAGVFIIWDRLFGTFQRESEDLPPRYGIIKQLGSFQLLHAVFHEWRAMLGDFWQAPWRHKLSYLFRSPGWSHDGSREGSDAIRARWHERQGET
ncbi:sterol desaturase family protein [Novosphingobium sp.]|uniref:sterol desaturase family protein n=1 Tax=Novosphingobium sp. TaxID=1874826 RepID=UPI00356710B7